MAELVLSRQNGNQPLVDGNEGLLKRTYFNLVRLGAGESCALCLRGFESLAVVLSGACDIEADDRRFAGIGQRADVWSGQADSVYAGSCEGLTIRAVTEGTEVAVAGGRVDAAFEPFRIAPGDVDLVDVGSPETHSRRRIYHILGNNHADRAGNLLVSELYADPGCWSGYPPHKHDEDRGDAETAHEELYHFRFRPETGFGAQFCFRGDGTRECYMTRHGDTFLLDRGYHPTVTSPGHEEYILTVLVGKTRRPLLQHFDESHRHLMSAIPGIDAMRAKFK